MYQLAEWKRCQVLIILNWQSFRFICFESNKPICKLNLDKEWNFIKDNYIKLIALLIKWDFVRY